MEISRDPNVNRLDPLHDLAARTKHTLLPARSCLLSRFFHSHMARHLRGTPYTGAPLAMYGLIALTQSPCLITLDAIEKARDARDDFAKLISPDFRTQFDQAHTVVSALEEAFRRRDVGARVSDIVSRSLSGGNQLLQHLPHVVSKQMEACWKQAVSERVTAYGLSVPAPLVPVLEASLDEPRRVDLKLVLASMSGANKTALSDAVDSILFRWRKQNRKTKFGRSRVLLGIPRAHKKRLKKLMSESLAAHTKVIEKFEERLRPLAIMDLATKEDFLADRITQLLNTIDKRAQRGGLEILRSTVVLFLNAMREEFTRAVKSQMFTESETKILAGLIPTFEIPKSVQGAGTALKILGACYKKHS
eukprot:Blabericola_migrator_1__19@NODE_1005_length_5722_cov_152_220336_g691_i0_p2_GENE_NODE_1005_length_5722_cov_152_220336_g691_i0NODE_1005_length_5722_cov_152_220336_g691_i0_p2_ORF_typecomplete_len362_score53_38_NODE_1005_length_5722_cov_152_220336_g691_i029964081